MKCAIAAAGTAAGPLYCAYKGQLIDNYVRSELIKSNNPADAELYTTRSGEYGPDVTDIGSLPDWVTWYDITTRASWAGHVQRYYPDFGPNGTGIFWDEIEAGDGGAVGGE